MDYSFYHPLQGLPRITLADVANACDPDALAALAAAVGVRNFGVRMGHAAGALLDSALPIGRQTPAELLNEYDGFDARHVLTGLLLTAAPDVVARWLVVDPPRLGKLTEQWNVRLGSAGGPSVPELLGLTFEVGFYRELCIWMKMREGAAITVDDLFALALPCRAAVEEAAAALGCKREPAVAGSGPPWGKQPVPAKGAYLDRHDGLAVLGRALKYTAGAVVSGPVSSGRTALVSALRSASRLGAQATQFGGWHWSAPADRRTMDATLEREQNCVFLVGFGARAGAELRLDDEGSGQEVWSEDAEGPTSFANVEEATLGPELKRAIEWVVEHPNRARVIIRMPEGKPRSPALRALTPVAVPPIAETDVAPIWLCHAVPAGVSTHTHEAIAVARAWHAVMCEGTRPFPPVQWRTDSLVFSGYGLTAGERRLLSEWGAKFAALRQLLAGLQALDAESGRGYGG